MPIVKSKLLNKDGTTTEIVAHTEPVSAVTQADKDKGVAERFAARLAKTLPGKKSDAGKS